MIKGEITLVVRDANTDSIVSEIKQENIITDHLFRKIANATQVNCRVAISNVAIEPSRFTPYLPDNDTSGAVSLVPSSRIPSVGTWVQYFPSTESNPDIMQVTGRYAAPAFGTSRTISTVLLVSGLGSTNPASDFSNSWPGPYHSSSGYVVMASSKLSTPCVQTDSQVVDIYYRVLFPTDSGEMPREAFSELIKRYVTSANGIYHRAVVSPFKFPTQKSYDSDKVVFSKRAFAHDYSHQNKVFNEDRIPTALINTYTRGINSTNPNFTDWTGTLFGSMICANEVSPFSFTNFNGFQKVQNLIAQAEDKTTGLASNWLDVDNLPGGNGKLSITGDWQNIQAPTSAGLYYSGKLPEYVRVKITDTGTTGTAKYKVIRQKTLGTYENTYTKSGYTAHAIFPLCTDETFVNDEGGVNSAPTPFTNKTIFGESNTSVFNGIHMSACQKYDDSSFIVVKSNMIILYNLAAGDYWKYTSTFTDIRQVAVSNGKIYVACRQTGLYVIDPQNSLTVQKIASTTQLDFSACYGVATGFNSKVWVVIPSGLACLDAGSWTLYNSSSSPAFSMTGVSNALWSNIEYLVVDKESATDQMLLVRRHDATADSSLLGVWWSTATSAVNTGAEPQSNSTQRGRPRIIRNHIGVSGGFWSILTQDVYRIMQFGQTTFTASSININHSNSEARRAFDTFQSVIFRKTPAGSTNQVVLHGGTFVQSRSGEWNWHLTPHVKLIDSTGAVSTSLTTNHGLQLRASFFSTYKPNNQSDWHYDTFNVYYSYNNIGTTPAGSYSGVYDQSSFFELCPGLIISIFRDVKNPANDRGFAGVSFQAFMYGLDETPDGGALKWLAQETYGWNGSSWEKDNANSKTTHTAAQPLFDGLNISFQDSTQFVSPNVYKFGLVDGLLKDNATRFTLNASPYYSTKVYRNQTALSSNTVPASASLPAGTVSFNPHRCSGGVTIDALDQLILPGRNSRQYAIGDKEVTGDFTIMYSVTNLNTDAMKKVSTFGVCRHEFAHLGKPAFGFIASENSLYWLDNDRTGGIVGIDASTTSLQLRRVGGALSLYRNNTLVRAISGGSVRDGDLRLSIMSSTWDNGNIANYPVTGVKIPATTIMSNGADNAIYLGDPVQRTGAYHPRFAGIDTSLPLTTKVWLDGVAATIKIDGTLPAAGEVALDPIKGILYFNVVDEGKAVAASYSYLQT